MFTLRLDPKLEQAVTKSELIRKSIHDYLDKLSKPNAWEIGEDLFGKYSSGLSNLSTNRKELIKSRLKAKRK